MKSLRDVSELQTERLEGRRLLSAASLTARPSTLEATGGTQLARVLYAGSAPGVEYVPHPEATLFATVEEVSVVAETPNSDAPTGTVTFFLDGVLAGTGNVTSDGIAYFQANPGVYTLTATYGGNQRFSSAVLPATRISIAESATGPSPFSGAMITTSILTVSDLGGTSWLIAGAPLQDSFEVSDDNTSSISFKDSLSVTVVAVSTSGGNGGVMQTLSTVFESTAHRVTNVPFNLNITRPDLPSGSYVLAYSVVGDGTYSTIYSDRTIAVSDAATQASTSVQVSLVKGLPNSLVSGTPVRGSADVTVTNGGTAAVKGTDTIGVYATASGTIDASSTLLGSVRRPLSLRPSKSASVTVPMDTFPAAAVGYTVLARVTDAAGTTADATAGPVVSVANPYVQLAGTIDKVSPAAAMPGRSLSFTLTLTNAGDAGSTGAASLAVYLSADGTTPAVAVQTLVRPSLTIRPGHPVRLRLTVKVPATAATMNAFPLVVVTQGQASTTAVV